MLIIVNCEWMLHINAIYMKCYIYKMLHMKCYIYKMLFSNVNSTYRMKYFMVYNVSCLAVLAIICEDLNILIHSYPWEGNI